MLSRLCLLPLLSAASAFHVHPPLGLHLRPLHGWLRDGPGEQDFKLLSAAEGRNTTFADVAGCDFAIAELNDIVAYIKNPEAFKEMGAECPRGILFHGPPGTGKTLLARAFAGEARVPFIVASGSSFVEVYVGTGARRVRDLFAKARKEAPCVLYIDEIDAVGASRGSASNGESDSTLNELLTQMDGFDSADTQVIMLASTNRLDILDDALLRPGRFDRRIRVPLPDVGARLSILSLHASRKKMDASVDLARWAYQTPGMSGADLKGLLNEAALQAVRSSALTVLQEHVQVAFERVRMGIRLPSSSTPSRTTHRIAVHECGHALLAMLLGHDEVVYVSVVPTNTDVGGFTQFLPDADKRDSQMHTRRELEVRCMVLLAGRVAEEVTFGEDEMSTGASGDLESVRNLVGFMFHNALYGHFTDSAAEQEHVRLLTRLHSETKTLLKEHAASLVAMTALLVQRQTVTGDEMRRCLDKD